MKIAFYEIEGWEEKIIQENFPKDEVFISHEKVGPLNLPNQNNFEVVSIFVNSKIDKKVLDSFPKVRLIATRSTGFDHIDLEACKARDIKIAYVPGYGDNTVAEFTFGLLLNLTRKIYESIGQMKETGSFSLLGMRGTDLKGKTMGVIGTGRIGKEVIKIAKGFGLGIVAFDPKPDINFAAENKVRYLSLDELLGSSDIITIHCPYNASTHYLINQKNISKIKRGAYLINTARGGIVETEALIEALSKGILAGAALDVLEEEGDTKDELNLLRGGHPREAALKTMLENHILMKMVNVLITPHNAFNSNEALLRILSHTLENIHCFEEGIERNLVKI
ncbi:MAG: Uncharacterized protein G01um101420_231 [Parcubacteria group bacterium Gr01-1014_20]|nr:MAG: Uncharacterized protein G01um101420_231 [Parcubacteria group bacterium Gr01-1014_20]